MSNHTTAIEVAGIAKSYGDQAVLRGIDLTVPVGTVYALVHENRIPHFRLGTRVVRFDLDELERWVRERHVPSESESRA